MGNKCSCRKAATLDNGERQTTMRKAMDEKKRYQKMLQAKESEILKTESQSLKAHDSNGQVSIDLPVTELEAYRARFLRTVSSLDDVDHSALTVDPKNFEFPFENLVFEGGGNKGLAYVGCIQYLEEHNMRPKIKRLAGASAGAITAALVALGYSSKDIYCFLSDNIEEVFLDHSCGYLSLLPNLLRRFGWNPGKKIYKWFGEKIKAKSASGNPDLTFSDLYKEKNMELCVLVTNLNQMRAEYCHPKTTPDMPIRDALCMSMAIPGVFSARRYDNHGQVDVYVDGGVLCNYPIHCFDGWYLSMAKEDAFLLRMQPLKDLPSLMSPGNRFGAINRKSIGCLLFDDSEMEVMRYNLEKRIGSKAPERPSKATKLYKEKQRKKEISDKAEREHQRVVCAVETFMKVLDKHNMKEYEFIDKNELKAALEDTESFPREQAEILFGTDIDVDTAFNILDKDGNGKVAFIELVQFIEEHGIRMQTRFQGYGRREVNNFPQFLSALQGTLLTNLKYVFVKEPDEARTIGINTGHVGTSDYCLEEEDREFVVKRGYNATETFLRYYVINHPELVKEKPDLGQASQRSAVQGLENVPRSTCGCGDHDTGVNDEDISLISRTETDT
ncbi:uncharacterized protein LOC106012608 [Aplysia californica]|uniref:Uncharacterized protein LOC106012608 n=1 Tax=Aplysia californica TaxID=6500 RepID=A0ABM1A602_APLCA|nr:uncharacterized protein LOC106012608 [Aplysia californica]